MRRASFSPELIGEELKVVAAANRSLCGLHGRVIDETKHTLTLETPQGVKKVLKRGAIFLLPRSGVRLDGDTILKRPEERLKRT